MRRSRHHPWPERPSNLQTLRPNGPVHLKNLPPLNPLNPGRGAAHPAAPFRLAALATHPPGRGWASKMEEENVALKTCRLWMERDREAAEGGLIKLAAKPPPPPSKPSEPSETSETSETFDSSEPEPRRDFIL